MRDLAGVKLRHTFAVKHVPVKNRLKRSDQILIQVSLRKHRTVRGSSNGFFHSNSRDCGGRRGTTGECHLATSNALLVLVATVRIVLPSRVLNLMSRHQVYQSSPAFYSTKAAAVVSATAFPQTVHSPVRCRPSTPTPQLETFASTCVLRPPYLA